MGYLVQASVWGNITIKKVYMPRIHLTVCVDVPDDFDANEIDLVNFLSQFLEIGMNDLKDSVEDEDIESTPEEIVVATSTQWSVRNW